MKKVFALVVLLSVLIIPFATKADGGIMPSPSHWIAETSQKAVIVSENGTETMILSTTFEGDAKDFAWIIPTPAQPQVEKGPYNIFASLENLTNTSSYSGIIYDRALPTMSGAEAPNVRVIEQKKVDVYDVAVLQANDQNALYDWLTTNNYNYPSYGKTILDSYIQNGWYFTAVKISQEDIAQAGNQLQTGSINPLKLVFASNKIVFPLKISSITMNDPNSTSSNESAGSSGTTSIEIVPPTDLPVVPPVPNRYMGITLYVFSDHKQQAVEFEPQYANWVEKDTIEKLAFTDNGDPWYTPSAKSLYLTSLYRNMSTSEMKDDVFLVNASDDNIIPPSHVWENVFLTVIITLILIISPFGLLYILFLVLFIFIKSRGARIAFLICQSILTLGGIITALAVLFSAGDSFSSTDTTALWLSVLIMVVAMTIGMILEIIFRKRGIEKKKTKNK